MASLLKTGRKKKGGDSAPEPAAEATTSMAMVATADPPVAQPPAAAPATSDYSPHTQSLANMPRSYGNASGYDMNATYAPPDGADDFQLPQRYIPAEPPPSPEPASGKGGLFSRVLLFSGEQTPEERDRVAAQEFEQAIAPVMEYMRAAVPEASTPEDAARILGENQGEITPDPKGGSFVSGDAFDNDARVYYRLLRRNYEKNPRPSETRKESHALSRAGGADGYKLLPGSRGW